MNDPCLFRTNYNCRDHTNALTSPTCKRHAKNNPPFNWTACFALKHLRDYYDGHSTTMIINAKSLDTQTWKKYIKPIVKEVSVKYRKYKGEKTTANFASAIVNFLQPHQIEKNYRLDTQKW
jgi:hypothetical protein